MFGYLSVQRLRYDPGRGEERPEDVEFLGEEVHPLLQALVLPEIALDLLLRLPRPHLGLLARLPHRDVVPLPPAPVLVAVLVQRPLARLGRAV